MDGEQDTRVCEESTSFGNSESSEHSLKLSQVKNGHKIQFKWLGDLFELKSFIAEELKVSGKWTHTDNNGGFDTLKSDGLSISFYSGTKTLNVQGAKMEIIRKKLLDLSNTSNISDSYESREDSPLEVDEQRENYHQSEIKSSAEEDEAKHGHCHRKYLSDHGKVDVAMNTFPPSPQVCPCRIEVNKMAAQMQELRLRVDNLAMASEPSYQELKQRIKMLENERDSLLTALRLLNNEAQCKENLHQATPSSSVTSSSPSLSSPRDNPTWSVVESSKRRRDKKKNHQQANGDSRPANQPTIQAENALNDQRGESTRSSKSVVILGDSMIKNIHGGKLSREAHVTLRSFSGSTVDDMIDFVRPFTRRKPDELILHIGTNDLKDEEPQQVAKKIVNLGLSIERETPSTKLTLSGIINRSDDQGLHRKVPKVNKALRSFCNSNGWKFLSNENIDTSCLNSGGLHLNRRGVYKLAGNFREVINGI